MLKTIILKGHKVTYDLVYKRVKNINLRIGRDASLSLSAPPHVSEAVIESFLLSKAEQILRALARCEALAKAAPKSLEYVDGEALRILGKSIPLRVVQGRRNAVESDGQTITLTVKDPADTALKERTVARWKRTYCEEIIRAECARVYPAFGALGIGFPILRFRSMKSRWGSCQPTKKILTFNVRLVEAPVECIEYVVTHEFVHFLEPNHSPRYYAHLTRMLPDWKRRKQILDRGN